MFKFIKKYWKNFDDSLFNPPKQTFSPKNFKGQNIHYRKIGQQGPKPTPEQVASMKQLDQQLKMQPRDIRVKNVSYGLMFLAWYAGATLFIMYRLKGDDMSSLQKQAKERQRRKKQLGV